MPANISKYVPQRSGDMRRPLLVWGIAAASALLIVCGALAAPIFASEGYGEAARSLYGGFSVVCHQTPERSFHAAGHPLAVCARCIGLYAGFLFGALLYPLVRSLRNRETPAREWLLLAAVPTSIDFALGVLGIWENTHLSRSLTGAILGAASAFYVAPGLVDLSYMSWKDFLRVRASASD